MPLQHPSDVLEIREEYPIYKIPNFETIPASAAPVTACAAGLATHKPTILATLT